MVKIKWLVIALLIIAMLALPVIAGCTTPAEQEEEEPPEPVTIRIASALPPVDIVVVKLQEMAERFNARTDEYIIEVHPGGTLASMEETFSLLRTGAIEMAESPIEYQTGDDIRFAAVTLPFLVDSLEANI
jgi:TRAP-type C4-dicarboxylate transport system substrate-binding protein